MISCGAKQIEITPPIGVPLAGYGSRIKGSEGIHDPLYAALVYLNDSSREILLVGLDLVAVDADFAAQTRMRITQETGIPEDSIMILCTHTHSGPDGYANAFPREGSDAGDCLRQNTMEKIAGAARWSKASAHKATIGLGSEHVSGVGLNRNDPYKKIDDQLTVVRIDVEGAPLAVLVNYACHPTVMSADNLQLSADLPGAVREYFQIHYPTSILLFMNGAAGDVSTRFTRRTQGFEELKRFGAILFGSILALMQRTQLVADDRIISKRFPIGLPVRDFPSETEAREVLASSEKRYEELKRTSTEPAELRKAETKILGARVQARFAASLKGMKTVESEIQIVQLGDLTMVGIPGEPFSGISLALKASFPDRSLMVVGYANDYMGYFPMGEQEQTYETLKSPWAASIGDFLVEKCVPLIQQVQGENRNV